MRATNGEGTAGFISASDDNARLRARMGARWNLSPKNSISFYRRTLARGAQETRMIAWIVPPVIVPALAVIAIVVIGLWG
jgi:hypothetical protein